MAVESATRAFVTDAPPSAPRPLFPAAGTHDTLSPALFTFTGSVDADGDTISYTVEVLDVLSGESRHIPCAATCESPLALGRAYVWKVVATDGILRAESPPVAFRTDAPPTPPPLGPGDDGSSQLPLAFPFDGAPSADPDGDALTYSVEIHDASGAKVQTCAGLVTPACDLRLPRFGETYAVRITASDGRLASTSTFRFTTQLPIVLVHGWNGDESTWSGLVEPMVDAGLPILDFSTSPGLQSLVYDPQGKGIVHTSVDVVGPAIERALVANGYTRDQPVDVIAHSMGGLVMRTLVEQAGVTVDEDGRVTVPAKWADQVRTLTLLATPNRGTDDASLCEGNERWGTACRQMAPGSPFLQFLGVRAGVHAPKYATLAGSADWVVDPESASLDDVDLVVLERACHAGSSGWGIYCDYPIVRAPGTLEALDTILGPRAGPEQP